jgi:bla regulator protein blaR1
MTGVWLDAMGRACLVGSVALFIAALLSRLLRRSHAGVRCWAWRLAFLKLFVALVCVTPIALPILPAEPVREEAVTQPGSEAGAARPAAEGAAPAPSTSQAAGSQDGLMQGLAAVAPVLLFGGWGLWVAFGLFRVAREYRDAKALVRSACPVIDPHVLHEFCRASRALGLRNAPELRVSDLADVPMLFGLVRPVVILPATLVSDCAPDEWRMMMAHELAHVKRRDLLWSCVAGAAHLLFFFHPLVWWAHRELRAAQETCCDELAIRSAGVSLHAYGQVLVRVAARCTTSKHDGLIAVAMAESFTTIQRRLEEMQTFRMDVGQRPWLMGAAAAVGLVALLPWRLEAQGGTAGSRSGSKSVQVGGYTLRIGDVEMGGSGAFPWSGGSGFSFG